MPMMTLMGHDFLPTWNAIRPIMNLGWNGEGYLEPHREDKERLFAAAHKATLAFLCTVTPGLKNQLKGLSYLAAPDRDDDEYVPMSDKNKELNTSISAKLTDFSKKGDLQKITTIFNELKREVDQLMKIEVDRVEICCGWLCY
jgi:hypothetical protein